MMEDETSENETTTAKLTRHIWITYKSRYNAHQRLINTDRIQKFTLTTIAVYILAVSVVILNSSILGIGKSAYVNVYLIILSIISLALSLTMGQSENRAKASELSKSARKLQKLYNNILIKLEGDPNYRISDETDKYNKILEKYNIDHDKIDWEYHIFEKRKEYKKNWLQMIIFYCKYFIFTKLLYLLLIILPIVAGIIIVIV